MEAEGDGGVPGTASGDASSNPEVDKSKPPEGETKVKRKMKTALQLEVLEKTYAMETYPSEALRAELSVKLGLSDRQLQMWFCHRRLKDRKPPSVKRPKKDALPALVMGSSGGTGDELLGAEVNNEHGLGSGSSPFRHLDLQLHPHPQQQQPPKRVVHRAGTALARFGPEMPAMKRYYEPPQAISELRAIAFVEAQLGEPLREDGPILGMEFDPLPPGAFGAPIVTGQQKPGGRPYETQIYERPDAKPIKGSTRTVHEYQFLPEQPSIRNETYERALPSSHYYGSPTDIQSTRTTMSSGRPFMNGSEQIPSAYDFQGQGPTLSLLPQQGRQGHQVSPVSGEDILPRRASFVDAGLDSHYGGHSIMGLESPLIPSDMRVAHDEERLERKRKSEEARIAKEVEAHEKRIRKELEKQDVLRRKREEQMRKEMERQDRERRKEEERLLREKQREEERLQREQRREMERREKFLQKESIRAEKMRLKEEMRREKEAARLKAANDRAAARRIAKESMELIEDERLELMELAAASRGLPTILALDNETLQNLESFRDKLPDFPPRSMRLKRPLGIQPWMDSEENMGNLLMVWRFLITFADVLGLWPFTLDEFIQAFHDYDPRLLGEIHIAILRSIIKDIEDVARTPATALGANQNSAANHAGGHPQIVEGAYAWGFDIRSWQCHLNLLTWPEILRQFALSAGFGPKLKNRKAEQAYPHLDNEGNDGEDIISNLRSGAAAENALAIMRERGLSNPRKSRHRLTPGTVKFAAFHILSIEGSDGLTILEVAEKIQKSGLRDLTTSKTPEASIAAALSRDTKLFERTAPSTYCVRAPYRKDPADAEAILSAAREKIRVFKNGYLDGEEAEDAEKEDLERDEDSESDMAEDPDVDDLDNELKLDKESFNSYEEIKFEGKNCSGNEIPLVELMGAPLGSAEKSTTVLRPLEGHGETKGPGNNSNQINDVGIYSDAANCDQEDNVIDESDLGEPWVQGLMEGEYSDLSVEERLQALVALIGVANEGNSIRIVLEERLEAASALKKQMWAEAQLDKRRIKDEYIIKMNYPSSIGYKADLNYPFSALEGRQSPLVNVDRKNELALTKLGVQQEDMGNSHCDLNHSFNITSEQNPPMQEFSAVPDNLQLQQSGYAPEKSRSQLKAYIGQRAEEMYVYRSLPLGQDRRRNRYWQFITSPSRNDPGSGRIFIELRDGRWRLIDSEEGFNALLASLDLRGFRESHLHSMLQKIEVSFKETARRNIFCTNSGMHVEDSIKKEISDVAPKPDCISNTASPESTICASGSDTSEPSASFAIGLGRTMTEQKDALYRYRGFEKWMWEECLNSSTLCAMKHGKRRCKALLRICDCCHNLYSLEDNHCPTCHSNFRNFNFLEHVNQCTEKMKGEIGRIFHMGDPLPPLRIRLLKTLLNSIEAFVPREAFERIWSEGHRESWVMKLLAASSADDLLKILTTLEAAIKRDFLLSDYETTSELLSSCNITADASNKSGEVGVLPWIPQTTAAVALRLFDLDSSMFYTLHQKENAQKEKEARDFLALPSKYAFVKTAVEDVQAASPQEARKLQQDTLVDPASGHISSGRGRGRGRGRARVRGGRSPGKVLGPRSESGEKGTKTKGDRFGHLLGWKGRARGRGGRKRARRSVRSRQKSSKNVVDSSKESKKKTMFKKTHSLDQHAWKKEKPVIQVEDAEDISSSDRSGFDDDNCQATGDEMDDLMVDDCPSDFNAKSGHLMEGVDYGDVEEDDAERAEGEEDMDDEDSEEVEEDDDEGQRDRDAERFFYDDDCDEENISVRRDQIGDTDRGSASSSSDYSD